tara:strand:- start:561 stop:713 length:153 start_codon:yes stop_codon:yes gene_type:complete
MIEPDPTILLSIPIGAFLGILAYRKFAERQKREAEWEKNKDKYKYKNWRY